MPPPCSPSSPSANRSSSRSGSGCRRSDSVTGTRSRSCSRWRSCSSGRASPRRSGGSRRGTVHAPPARKRSDDGEEARMPKLTLVLDRKPVQVYELEQAVIRIGRGETMDVLIDNVSVSRRHAEIREENGAWLLRDLGSSNGTFLNGQRVSTEQPLRPGDEISF